MIPCFGGLFFLSFHYQNFYKITEFNFYDFRFGTKKPGSKNSNMILKTSIFNKNTKKKPKVPLKLIVSNHIDSNSHL